MQRALLRGPSARTAIWNCKSYKSVPLRPRPRSSHPAPTSEPAPGSCLSRAGLHIGQAGAHVFIEGGLDEGEHARLLRKEVVAAVHQLRGCRSEASIRGLNEPIVSKQRGEARQFLR